MVAGTGCVGTFLRFADGDVDRGELREIVGTLARAGHTPKMIDAVKEALGDGNMDDDDRALLERLVGMQQQQQ